MLRPTFEVSGAGALQERMEDYGTAIVRSPERMPRHVEFCYHRLILMPPVKKSAALFTSMRHSSSCHEVGIKRFLSELPPTISSSTIHSILEQSLSIISTYITTSLMNFLTNPSNSD